jgi:hypothetical protein
MPRRAGDFEKNDEIYDAVCCIFSSILLLLDMY